MNNRCAVIVRWVVVISILTGLWSATYATRYWTSYDYQKSQQAVFGLPQITQAPPLEYPVLDSYSYMFEYFQICHFLSLWQVADSLDPNYGGMIEGETGEVANIVQTDNTQEAIRVWCQYGEMTGDLETYRDNIDAAWVYTMNFPAYSEEGNTDYYRLHNCGWALIAQMMYLDVYGDPTYVTYADSCARYMQTHRLNFNYPDPFYQRLHPLVTGWAAGSLYQYGLYTGEQSYVDSALSMADRVIEWVETDPSRLNTTEVWAMSAGTAMWGICASRFLEEPTYGQTWLSTYASYLDTWQPTGQWNNSWNVWYAHAYHFMYDVTGGQEFFDQAVSNVDMLLAMDTDNDGGIMATSTDPDTVDQTWVSCYLDWMGISYILDELEDRDAGIIAIITPVDTLPLMVGDTVDVTVVAGNLGLDDLGTVPVSITGGFSASANAQLPQGGVDTVVFSPPWILQSHGEIELTAYTNLSGDENPSNDSLTITVQVLTQSAIAGRVYDVHTSEGIGATLMFYHHLYPPEEPYDSTTSDPVTGNYQAAIPIGEYRVVVVPEYPYTPREWSGIQVVAGDTTIFDVLMAPAPLILVDDDDGGHYEDWFIEPLEQLGYDTYYWDVSERDNPGAALLEFRDAVWFTGNASSQALSPEEISSMEDYLDAGGNLLITGQDIESSLEGTTFASDYLHAQIGTHSVIQRILDGVAGDPVSGGMSLMIVGAGGAQNQSSPGVVTAISGGVEIFHYNSIPPTSGAVRYDGGSYKTIVMTFGVEGVSALGGTNSRQELMESVLVWFDPVITVPKPVISIPLTFGLRQNYPNPFNAATRISFELPVQSKVALTIFNVLGERVRTLVNNSLESGSHSVIWDGKDATGTVCASGVYLYRLQVGELSDTKKLVVLR